MKFKYWIEAVTCYMFAFSVIGFLWMLLEQIIYGEVQHRVVDDIIAVFLSLMAWMAYALGRQHGKESL